MTEQERIRLKRGAARWSLFSNSTLLVLKIIVGVITGSVGVLAEIVNSSADLMGAVIAFLSVKVSDEPPDQSHAYGHGKIENLSGVATASLILVGGLYAVGEAIWKLFHPSRLPSVGWAIVVMAASFLVNLLVSRQLLRVGKQTDSPALIADGYHLGTDVLTSLGVLAGLVLVHFTHQTWWDSIAALGVSLLILRVGYTLAHEAVGTLADATLPREEEEILTTVIERHPEVLSFHKLRTRKSGSHRHVDVHVQIADTHTFIEAHRLTEDLEDQMRDALPNVHPIIHMEPYEDEEQHQREKHGAG